MRFILYQINEEVSNTHGKRERVKIPLLPNRVGKRSGTNDNGHNSKLSLKYSGEYKSEWVK